MGNGNPFQPGTIDAGPPLNQWLPLTAMPAVVRIIPVSVSAAVELAGLADTVSP